MIFWNFEERVTKYFKPVWGRIEENEPNTIFVDDGTAALEDYRTALEIDDNWFKVTGIMP